MPESGRKVRVAVDAMGGDYAPEEVVKGAVYAARQTDVEIILTGPVSVLKEEMAKCGASNNLPIRCVEATESIGETESPAAAIRHKPNSSLVVATRLVKSGEADALVSAGPSGATAVGAVAYLGMVEGIDRPTVGGPLGSFAPGVLLIDLGANVDCKPSQFLSFAVAGSVFARKFLNIENPTVALLSVGAEEGKGNGAVREAYTLLKNSGLNFIGNIEGNEVLSGKANVIVCDGFVGNVLFKFYESIATHALLWVKRKLRRQPLLWAMIKLFFNKVFPVAKMTKEGEVKGAGILWGVDGVVRIAHGASKAMPIASAIIAAKNAVEADIVGCLKAELVKFNTKNVCQLTERR